MNILFCFILFLGVSLLLPGIKLSAASLLVDAAIQVILLNHIFISISKILLYFTTERV